MTSLRVTDLSGITMQKATNDDWAGLVGRYSSNYDGNSNWHPSELFY